MKQGNPRESDRTWKAGSKRMDVKIARALHRSSPVKMAGAYMTVEAALVMSVVVMVYVFLIDCMLFQYERCVTELESARKNVKAVEWSELLYETKQADPIMLLRLQRAITQKQKEEEKVK